MAEDLAPYLNAGFPLAKQPQEASAADNGPDMAMNESIANEIFRRRENHNEHRDAALLLAVAAIATKEIHIDGVIWDDDKPPVSLRKFFPDIPSIAKSNTKAPSRPHLTPRFTDHRGHDSSEEMDELELPPVDDRFVWNRARAVSLDAPDDEHMRDSPELFLKGDRGIVTPESSPVSRRMPLRKPGLRPVIKRRSDFVGSVGGISHSEKRTLLPRGKAKRLGMKTILRKKFSWKNYPELEQFLIANRNEYLRHSALNYTVQQKEYNNRLTERLLELAVEQGYVFDEEAFSFVTVRDRIRCYYKSFVQSAKKRGIIIGYAARKAGLLTEEDLEKSAGIEGRIVLPS